MSLDQVSATTKTACRGAYSINRLSRTYAGPTFNVRRGSDNVTADFYASCTGDLGLALNASGATLTAWLAGASGYVATWYDQSGNGNHATQGTQGQQPKLNTTTNNVDFYNNTVYLNMPSGTVPVGTSSAPYTIVAKHSAVTNTTAGTIVGAGGVTGNTANVLRCNGSSGYVNSWWSTSYTIGSTTPATGNTVVASFNGSTQYGWVNGVATASSAASGNTTSAGQQYIGIDVASISNYTDSFTGQLNYVLVFGSAVPDADRVLLTAPVASLSLDEVTSTSKNACRGAYATARLSSTYTGPTLNFRRSSDNATSDFYADASGNLGTALNATGTQLSTWLGGATAYVVTWYDQSGNGNNGTQATTTAQPVYASTGAVDFWTDSTRFLGIPTGTVTTGTPNAPYTFLVQHGAINNSTNGTFIGSGDVYTHNCTNNFRCAGTSGYINWWQTNDYTFGTAVEKAGNTVACTFDGSTRRGFVNSAAMTSSASTGLNVTAGQQYIGKQTAGEFLNGQLYFAFVFNIAVPDADRVVLENTLVPFVSGAMVMALSNASLFSDTLTGDIALSAYNPDNSVRLGGSQGVPSTMQITPLGAKVVGSLTASNAYVTGALSAGGTFTACNVNFMGNLQKNGVAYSATQFNTSGTSVFLTSSNVGIGLSNPAYALDVIGTINSSNAIWQGGSNLSTVYAGLAYTTAAATFASNAVATITTQANAALTGAWRIVSGNATTLCNVGIGTTAPTSPLDVVTGAVTMRNGRSNFTTPASFSNYQVLFGWNNTASFMHGLSTRHSAGGGSSNAMDFSLWNNTTGAYPQTLMTVTTNGVGVSNVNPLYGIDVTGAAQVATNLLANNAAVYAVYAAWAGFAHCNFVGSTNSSAISQDGSTSSGTNVNSAPGQAVLFANNGVAMGTVSNLMLGVGTTAPAFELDVSGNNNVRVANAGVNHMGIILGNASNALATLELEAASATVSNAALMQLCQNRGTLNTLNTSVDLCCFRIDTRASARQFCWYAGLLGTPANMMTLCYYSTGSNVLSVLGNVTSGGTVVGAPMMNSGTPVLAAGAPVLAAIPDIFANTVDASFDYTTYNFSSYLTAGSAPITWAASYSWGLSNQWIDSSTGIHTVAPYDNEQGTFTVTATNASGSSSQSFAFNQSNATGGCAPILAPMPNVAAVTGNGATTYNFAKYLVAATAPVTWLAQYPWGRSNQSFNSSTAVLTVAQNDNESGIFSVTASNAYGSATQSFNFQNQPTCADRLVANAGAPGAYGYTIGMNNNALWSSVPATGQQQYYYNGVAGMTLSNNMLGVGTSNPTQALDVTSGMMLRNGAGAVTFTGTQVQLAYAGSSNYSHAINTRHQSGGGTGNAIDFMLWNSNQAASAVGTTAAMTVAAGNWSSMIPASFLPGQFCIRTNANATNLSYYCDMDPTAWTMDPDARLFTNYMISMNWNAWFYANGSTLIHITGLVSWNYAGGSTGGNGSYNTIYVTAVTVAGATVTSNSLTGEGPLVLYVAGAPGTGVGIGTTTPAYNLDVVGRGNFSLGINGGTVGALLLRAYEEGPAFINTTTVGPEFRGRVVDYMTVANVHWQQPWYGSTAGTSIYSARICGYICPPQNDTYTFACVSDDGVRMWINDVRQADAWWQQGSTTYTGAPMALTAGQWYPIVIEQYNSYGFGEFNVQWKGTTYNTSYQYLTHGTGTTAMQLAYDLWDSAAPTRFGRLVVSGAMDSGHVFCPNVYQSYLLTGTVAAGGPTMYLNFANGGADASATGTYTATLAGSTTTSSTTTTLSGSTVKYLTYTNTSSTSLTTVCYPTASAKTISFWVNTTRAVSSTDVLFGGFSFGSTNGSQFAFAFPGGSDLCFNGDFNDYFVGGSSSFAWANTGAWTHVVFTQDATNMVQMFVNGNPICRYWSQYQISSTSVPTISLNTKFTSVATTTTLPFVIRYYNTGGALSQVYNFRSIMYYTRCLSSDEIESLYYTT